jgi:hypothetical protein
VVENIGNLWRAQGRRVRLELKHFRRHVMTQVITKPDEVEGWRGEIRDGEVVSDGEDQDQEVGDRQGRGEDQASAEEEGRAKDKAAKDEAEDEDEDRDYDEYEDHEDGDFEEDREDEEDREPAEARRGDRDRGHNGRSSRGRKPVKAGSR